MDAQKRVYVGIIAMNVLRDQAKLVGWTFPYGNVLVHDLRTGRTDFFRGAQSDGVWLDVSRVVITTRGGAVFTSYERDPRVPESAVLHKLTLSPDETKLFTIPRETTDSASVYHLIEYDLATGQKTDLGDFGRLLEGSTPTGNGVFDDQGRYYLSFYFGSENRSGILQVDVSERLGSLHGGSVSRPPAGSGGEQARPRATPATSP